MKYRLLPFLIAIIIITASCNQNTETTTQSSTADTSEELNFIFPKGQKGPDKNFTGNAYNIGLVNDSTLTTIVGNVYFEPGARSNWHTHPAGQILIITDGVGYHQIEGQPIQVIKKGDAVTCPPNTRHWHGASHDTGLQQMYVVPNIEKGVVNWMEAVTDEVYDQAK
ncbi:cupin domain-containing protein [Fulvivirga ligni]|uniref:cupin domain-containing protein n=1 Tax=Fulvivirga ligni TaxID=2904246 RepID=UPI001F2BC00C|nr:cupin domain-containing protein [Fulvivirga ligni]UII24040.1 cupin domain-containing protein [Fulvivirga ligni]